MEESISRLVRQLAEGSPGGAERPEAAAALVAGARSIVESLLELAGGGDDDLRRTALSALADITMSIHQAGFSVRHSRTSGGDVAGLLANHDAGEGSGRLFGEVAIGRGLARVEDVLKALNTQKREVLAGQQPRLIGEILMADGVLDQEQVRTVLMDIRGRLLKHIERQLSAPGEED